MMEVALLTAEAGGRRDVRYIWLLPLPLHKVSRGKCFRLSTFTTALQRRKEAKEERLERGGQNMLTPVLQDTPCLTLSRLTFIYR
jgi:hypothetical protein